MEAIIRPHCYGQKFPLHTHHKLQHKADHERGNGNDKQRHDQDSGVKDTAAADTSNHAEGHTEDGFKNQCHHGEFDGHRERVRHHFSDGPSREGCTEVKGEHTFEVQQVLDNKWLIQIVFSSDASFRCC